MIFKPVAVLALFLSAMLSFAPSAPVQAQDASVWLQIEAQPDLAGAEDRARAYASVFADTNGFRLRSGWYGIMLGPYPADEAALRLGSLKREGLIPGDSFIALSRDFGLQYWPPAGSAAAVPDPVTPEIAALPEPAPLALASPDETRTEARDSEALLTADDRKALQTALQWFGLYRGAIDGAFGPGTRNSMSAWQAAQGIDPTGILTSRQRAALLAAYGDDTAAFGFATVADQEAGITVTLPLGLVEFDHYEPPFVHFRPRNATAPRIILISQPGDQAAFYGLYDILQTLESVPMTGDRSRDERKFRIEGRSDTASTTAYGELRGGLIKGWMLISTPGNQDRDARILQAIEASFATDSTRALDPGMEPMGAEARAGLLSGLEVRKPRFSRSGFFVDASGTVLTTVDAVASCGRITLDRATEASVTLTDAASGLAILSPATPLSPRMIARLQLSAERVGTEVMVAGYSYEDRLPAPVMTFGTLEAVTGLNGETGLKRLAIETLAGDAGGPVLDATGAVIGMLLPAATSGPRQLPAGVQFAASAAEIARIIAPGGIAPLPASPGGALPPAELTETGSGMTVLVSCWD
ncbi:serine protease [Tabrizicola sp.]|uniref:serine protease n=1 Tax=Tabrizicola sp. TaxID=2005166 RepID=UPI0026355367|nr:serine protease [Tabrizicola sp.]MDM7932380.1 serine protease [Tabrizicola sp.]